jgi:hypothetical protein
MRKLIISLTAAAAIAAGAATAAPALARPAPAHAPAHVLAQPPDPCFGCHLT